MPKVDKKDTKKDEKSSRIYIDDDDDEPSAARISAPASPKLSKPGASTDDVKLRDIIEKAKENDPNRDKDQYKAAAAATEAKYTRLFSESPSTAPQKPVMPVEEKHTDEDGLRIFIFIGVLAGFIILLSIFGGPYSPLALLGSTLDPNATAKPANPVVIPQPPAVNNTTVANTTVDVQPPVAPAKEVVASIVISNWKMEPAVVNAKVGEVVTIQFIASEMQFDISIDGFDVKEQIKPGEPISITITPTSAGPYNIHAMTWSAGRTVEATGVLLVE